MASPDPLPPELATAASGAAAYLGRLPHRAVTPTPEALAALDVLDTPLPEDPTEPAEVVGQLAAVAGPAMVASAGGRYFGFVTGGSLPVTVGAAWLAAAWDQNTGMEVMSPAAVRIERIAARWLLEVLGLPTGSAVGLVTGATAGNLSALGAARHAVLARAGWDVGADGLFGAPPIQVVVGDEVHVSLLKALALLGLGRDRVTRVPVDGQGRMRADSLPPIDDRTIVCVQAGNVNTGATDPLRTVCDAAHEAGGWCHVDGAFGLWLAAAPERAGLVDGIEQADSWATDAHKWLNVPYDCGVAICRDPGALAATMATGGAYLQPATGVAPVTEPFFATPEMSRRARGIEVWAALRSLGRHGVADLVERTCRHADRFAAGLRAAGFEVLNDVVANQVLVSFGDDERTRRTVAGVQADGTCWCGSTVWQGRTAMRISVSSWATTADDVERSLAAIVGVAGATA
jgi:glutamate/tyrosine decarboxylase-like PLP-dependent enzyme